MHKQYFKNIIKNILISKYPAKNNRKHIKIKNIRCLIKTYNYTPIYFWYLFLLNAKKPYQKIIRKAEVYNINSVRNQIKIIYILYKKGHIWKIFSLIDRYLMANRENRYIIINNRFININFSNASYTPRMAYIQGLNALYPFRIPLEISLRIENTNIIYNKYIAQLLGFTYKVKKI